MPSSRRGSAAAVTGEPNDATPLGVWEGREATDALTESATCCFKSSYGFGGGRRPKKVAADENCAMCMTARRWGASGEDPAIF